VHGASSATIQDVLRWGMHDWEDAPQAAAAKNASASFIGTRNVKDFKFSRVPALNQKILSGVFTRIRMKFFRPAFDSLHDQNYFRCSEGFPE